MKPLADRLLAAFREAHYNFQNTPEEQARIALTVFQPELTMIDQLTAANETLHGQITKPCNLTAPAYSPNEAQLLVMLDKLLAYKVICSYVGTMTYNAAKELSDRIHAQHQASGK